MRIIDIMQNSSPAKTAALYEKEVSTLTETRVANVYAHEIDNAMSVTQYRVDCVIHRPNAKQGWERQSSSLTFPTAAEMHQWLRGFFALVELMDDKAAETV